MARYRLGIRTTVTAIGACCELRASASERVRLMEIAIVEATAVASLFGIGRPAAIGVTPTTPVAPLALDPADSVATSTTALAWATAPTSPTAFITRGGVPSGIGNGIIWSFGPQGLIVPVSSSIVLWNFQVNALFDVTFRVDE